ncbi:hypothetical protein HY522_12795 [bacterium]|nr:hypothetical protein [bacterium]
MKTGIWILCLTVLGLGMLTAGFCATASAAERTEEATVLGKDRSKQAGVVPSDTRAAEVDSKLKQEETPSGLKSGAPGVRTSQKMEKPKMAEPERKKPEGRKGFGGNIWIWILVIGGIAAAAG